jgi:hypothetical protein
VEEGDITRIRIPSGMGQEFGDERKKRTGMYLSQKEME